MFTRPGSMVTGVKQPGRPAQTGESSASGVPGNKRAVERTSNNLQLEIGQVIKSKRLRRQIEQNEAGEDVHFGNERDNVTNIRARYEPKHKLIRIYDNDRGVVNIDIDNNAVCRIQGSPKVTRAKLQGLIDVGLFSSTIGEYKKFIVSDSAPAEDGQLTDQAIPSTSLFNRRYAPSITSDENEKLVRHSLYGNFCHLKDIVRPEELENLVLGRDYVIIVHRSKEHADLINQNGLKNLRTLAEDGDLAELPRNFKPDKQWSRMENDPDLIYFCPLHKERKLNGQGIVIAIRAAAGYVYDQECRTSHRDGTLKGYENSQIPVLEYLEKMNNKQPGTFLSPDKRFVHYDSLKNGSMYIPEICVKTDKIPPSLFLSREQCEKLGIL